MGAAGSTTAAYRRRIELVPGPGAIEAEMEDFVHHFALRIEHRDGVVARAEGTGRRVPWSTCGAGAAGLAALAGTSLAAATDVGTWAPDRATQCVHVVDLALLAVRHATDPDPTTYEILVTPGWGERRRAVLRENDRVVLEWDVDGDMVADDDLALGRGPFFATLADRGVAGRALEHAVVLRRACHIAPSRGVDLDDFDSPAEIQPPDNTCFTYRSDVAIRARRVVGTTRATETEEQPWI